MNNFAKNIKQLRLEKKLTQLQLGKHLGVGRHSISTWELGTREPSIDRLIDICNFFSISLDELIREIL